MNANEIEQASAKIYKAPRVTLADIEAAIASVTYTAASALLHTGTEWRNGASISEAERTTQVYTICMVTLRNGWVVIGGAAPASPENFDPEHGRKLALDKCMQQIWPLMGFALKQHLYDRRDVGTVGQGG